LCFQNTDGPKQKHFFGGKLRRKITELTKIKYMDWANEREQVTQNTMEKLVATHLLRSHDDCTTPAKIDLCMRNTAAGRLV
jgi:hypothetical protein